MYEKLRSQVTQQCNLKDLHKNNNKIKIKKQQNYNFSYILLNAFTITHKYSVDSYQNV